MESTRPYLRWGTLITLMLALSPWAYAVSDYQWTFGDVGNTSFTILDVSSTRVYNGPLGAEDPGLTIQSGKRYQVTVVNSAFHPFQVIAKGADAGLDVVLLSQGATAGTLEGDPGIDWTDDLAAENGKVEFTVTQTLISALSQGGRSPGYRCAVHSDLMRGNFTIAGLPIDDPIPAPVAKGEAIVELQTLASGLTAPLGIVFSDDGSSRAFIYDQTGEVHVLDNGSLLPTPFLDVSSRLVALNPAYDERGLLGFALHPEFAANGKVYTYTSEPVSGTADFPVTLPVGVNPNHQSVVAEWTVLPGNPNLVDTASRRELLRIDQPQGNHNGGSLQFGTLDGLLYIALGDGGGANDTGNGHGANGNGQDIAAVLGSILRIDVDGGFPSANGEYGIPPSNPFATVAGADEIFAYGFRNPYAFSFDSLTGDLYAGDVGQNAIEEVDLVVAGGNYGWRVKEGSFFFNTGGFVTDVPQVDPAPSGLIDPIAQYDHDEGIALVGGYVVRSTAIPNLHGHYVFGDFGAGGPTGTGRLFYLGAADQVKELQIGSDDRGFEYFVKGFGQDLTGTLYVCASETVGPSGSTGVVIKLVPTTDDFDGDGLTDADEAARGTNPMSADTDGDGLPDGWEVVNGFDPLDDGSADITNGANGDPDGDDVPNITEYWLNTDPNAPTASVPAAPWAVWPAALCLLGLGIAVTRARRLGSS